VKHDFCFGNADAKIPPGGAEGFARAAPGFRLGGAD